MKIHSIESSLHSRSPKRTPPLPAFTLVELLVVFVIVVVLATVTLSITQSARRSAVKASDLSNLRSLATATMAAGADAAGRFPNVHASGHNTPYYLTSRETLESYGIFKESCYINDRKVEGGPPNYSFWYMFPNQTPTHYCYFAKDAPTGNSWFQNGTVTPPSQSEYRGRIPYNDIIRDPSKAFARGPSDDAWYPVLWAGISRDWAGKPHLAAVMKDGQALGVNVMYIDGSAKWVDKKQMKPRYTAGSLTVFW